ncbi:hypothetical protein FA95DRAFT_964480 [Auriscalpium vulgare]|uniref:Uncharacterized protein n=1 Tax=Auriscalpium vulgare TaxID=40419 RepID=A0ACB8RZN7_9AGAM|nr:hypothetical protein FA95DRAFT_964480 [Auriscalpium vulgare]
MPNHHMRSASGPMTLGIPRPGVQYGDAAPTPPPLPPSHAHTTAKGENTGPEPQTDVYPGDIDATTWVERRYVPAPRLLREIAEHVAQPQTTARDQASSPAPVPVLECTPQPGPATVPASNSFPLPSFKELWRIADAAAEQRRLGPACNDIPGARLPGPPSTTPAPQEADGLRVAVLRGTIANHGATLRIPPAAGSRTPDRPQAPAQHASARVQEPVGWPAPHPQITVSNPSASAGPRTATRQKAVPRQRKTSVVRQKTTGKKSPSEKPPAEPMATDWIANRRERAPNFVQQVSKLPVTEPGVGPMAVPSAAHGAQGAHPYLHNTYTLEYRMADVHEYATEGSNQRHELPPLPVVASPYTAMFPSTPDSNGDHEDFSRECMDTKARGISQISEPTRTAAQTLVDMKISAAQWREGVDDAMDDEDDVWGRTDDAMDEQISGRLMGSGDSASDAIVIDDDDDDIQIL